MQHLVETWLVPEMQAVEGIAKQRIFFTFDWLYLKINICEFRLILCDHIANVYFENKSNVIST